MKSTPVEESIVVVFGWGWRSPLVFDRERRAVGKPRWIVHAGRLRTERFEVPPARVDDAHPDVRAEVEGDVACEPAPVGSIGNLDLLVLKERRRRGPALRQVEQIELRTSEAPGRFQHRALEDDRRAQGVDDATIVVDGCRGGQEGILA